MKKHIANRTTNIKKNQAGLLLLIGLVILLLPVAVFSVSAKQRINVAVSSSVPYNHCVDGIQNFDETGIDCGGATCPACSGGGGGGGGGGGITLYSSVAFSGKTAPGATVHILRNGILSSSVTANLSGDFGLTITNLLAGTYNFTIYYTDTSGRKSSSIIHNITIGSNQNLTVSNILLPPTIEIDQSQIAQGDLLKIFGQSIPNSQISLFINPLDGGPTTSFSSVANQFGLYNFDYIANLPFGSYVAKTNAKFGNLTSGFSLTQIFAVGTTTIEKPIDPKCPPKGDVNYDCRVNLIDFSITAYWFKRPISPEFLIIEKDQLSGDGKIDLVDFSILAYYWTG